MICKEVNYDLAMQEWGNLLDSGSLSKDQKSVAWSHLGRFESGEEYGLLSRCPIWWTPGLGDFQ